MASNTFAVYHRTIERIMEEVERCVIGQREMIDVLLMGLFSKGHVYLESIPGQAKSLAVEALAQTIIGEIKFVDERLDVTGANILVVDEINRMSLHTRTALLKVMQERQIIINNELYYLNQPLMVVATANPGEGNELNSAELDRFMIYYRVDFPEADDEMRILKTVRILEDIRLKKLINCAQILDIQRIVEKIRVDSAQLKLITELAWRTRMPQKYKIRGEIKCGLSTRALMYVLVLAKARTFLYSRKKVTKADVLYAFSLIAPHRIQMCENSEYSAHEIVDHIISSV